MPKFQTCVRVALRSALTLATAVSLSFAVSGAQAHPGVHLVLTGADLPIEFGILPVTQDEEASGEASWEGLPELIAPEHRYSMSAEITI